MIRSGALTGGLTAGLVNSFNWGQAAEAVPAGLKLHWLRDEASRLFTNVQSDGAMLAAEAPGLLDGFCRLVEEAPEKTTTLGVRNPTAVHGQLQLELRHQLMRSGGGSSGEDVLEATLTLKNGSSQPLTVELGFATSAQPSPLLAEQHVYIPLNAAGGSGDLRFAPLGVANFLKDCRHKIGGDGLQCHYLEPLASYPGERTTRALLLAPVVDIFDPLTVARVALFTASDQPIRFSTVARQRGWRAGRCLTIPAGESVSQRCWLMIHAGDAAMAWTAFHRFAHVDPMPRIAWLRDFKVHYFDFLSAAGGANHHRGDGYDTAIRYFREFHVGMATQHGYYPCMGDHIHPDRKRWLAMQGDKQGPVEMSFEKIKERIKATRMAGAKAAIYMHQSAMDDSSNAFYPGLAAARRIGSDGKPAKFGWNGPDVKGGLWWMSMAAPEWRAHLLQQAQWIMEIFKPDAIVMDETFSGLGYDETPGRQGPLGSHTVDFCKKMRALVRSFGDDKAFFTSDCSMAGFVMWADGEAGDHCYPSLSGHPLYAQEPVRFLAALGDKPWRPCAWSFQGMWEAQMKLARQLGAGVGLSNGWIEYTGLHRLPLPVKEKMIADIESILPA